MRKSWTNIVAACDPCNVKKDNKLDMKPTWGLPQRVSNQALIPVRTANGCARSLIELYSAIQPGDYPTRRFRTGTSRATTGGASGVIKDLIGIQEYNAPGPVRSR